LIADGVRDLEDEFDDDVGVLSNFAFARAPEEIGVRGEVE
jgi:hypothetical protein